MAKRKDGSAQAAEAATAPAIPAADAPAAMDAPPIEIPMIGPELAASAGSPSIDAAKIEPIAPNSPERAPPGASAEELTPDAAGEAAAPAPPVRPRWPRYAPLAATVALAAALGALAGAATTAGLLRDAAAPAAGAVVADASRGLRDSVARLQSELATVKAGIDAAEASATAQFGKLTQRLERADKAQAEPAARLAKIAESLDRVERRIGQAQIHAPAHAAPEVTGSVTAAKQESKPPLADGWRLRDFYAGRAVVESRSGRLFEIAAGSNLPGLGRVETIKREDGQVVVVTRNGIIAASLQPRRLPRYLPYID